MEVAYVAIRILWIELNNHCNSLAAQQGNPNPLGRNKARAQGSPPARGPPDKTGVVLSSKDALRDGAAECDLPESPFDDAEVRIGRGLKYPQDKGYGKFLETLVTIAIGPAC